MTDHAPTIDPLVDVDAALEQLRTNLIAAREGAIALGLEEVQESVEVAVLCFGGRDIDEAQKLLRLSTKVHGARRIVESELAGAGL